jgi:hypothetical protein
MKSLLRLLLVLVFVVIVSSSFVRAQIKSVQITGITTSNTIGTVTGVDVTVNGHAAYYSIGFGDDTNHITSNLDDLQSNNTFNGQHVYTQPGTYAIIVDVYDRYAVLLGSDTAHINMQFAAIKSPLVGAWRLYEWVDVDGGHHPNTGSTLALLSNGRYQFKGDPIPFKSNGAYEDKTTSLLLAGDTLLNASRPAIYILNADSIYINKTSEGTLYYARVSAGVSYHKLTSSLNVYPNPATSSINIMGLTNDVESIRLIDILGVTVREIAPFRATQCSIELSCLKPGVYYVRVSTSRAVLTSKIIVE